MLELGELVRDLHRVPRVDERSERVLAEAERESELVARLRDRGEGRIPLDDASERLREIAALFVGEPAKVLVVDLQREAQELIRTFAEHLEHLLDVGRVDRDLAGRRFRFARG